MNPAGSPASPVNKNSEAGRRGIPVSRQLPAAAGRISPAIGINPLMTGVKSGMEGVKAGEQGQRGEEGRVR